MKTTMYLVRHGEYKNPTYVHPGRLPGFPLSQKGREQVLSLAKFFKNTRIAALYSSPILRCKQTAEILSDAVCLPIFFDDHLLEVRTMADGEPMKRFDDTNGELSYTPEYIAKGAESMADLTDRMVGFVEEKRKEHEGKEVLVVTHGDPMRFCVMHYMGLPIDFPTSRQVATPIAGGYRIEFDSENQAQVYPIVSA